MQQPYYLTNQQIDTLKLTYKYRFITTHLLASYRNLTSYKSGYQNLERLVNQKYLVKRISKQDRINRRSAIYYLSAKGIRYLRETQLYAEPQLHVMHKNGYASQAFVDLHLLLVRIQIILRSQYLGVFQHYSRIEATALDDDITAKPDVYLRRHDETKQPGEYFLYVITDIQLFIIKRLIKKIIADYDVWPSDEYFPTLLLVCPTLSVARRIVKYLESLELDDEPNFFITTSSALLQADNPEVWIPYLEDEQLISL